MNLSQVIYDIQPIIERYQKLYGDAIASSNDLYYNHGYEILGMLGANELDIDKLPQPLSDTEQIEKLSPINIKPDQQLAEYVITPISTYLAIIHLFNDLQQKMPILKQLSIGTQLVLMKLLAPQFRQILLKRNANTVPVLYAPSKETVAQDLYALTDTKMVIELWTKLGFQKVNGSQLFTMVMNESQLNSSDLQKMAHLQTFDDLAFEKRLVLPLHLRDEQGHESAHGFDVILTQSHS